MLNTLLTLCLLISPAVAGTVANEPAGTGALAAGPAPPARIAAPGLPGLADFAQHATMTGHEQAFLARVEALLPSGLRVERDALGSLIVWTGDPDGPVRVLVSVGVDEPGYVVSRIRDDGYLRLRTVGHVPDDFHLLNEARPVTIGTRHGEVPGVTLINAIHLRGARPETVGEEHLWVDVGADDAAGVAALGIELLDPVLARDVVALQHGRVAGPSLGRRAAALAMLRVMHELPAGTGGLAFAFVAQSRVGTWMERGGPQGRGGEAVQRRVEASRWLALDATEGEVPMVPGPELKTGRSMDHTWFFLGVEHHDTPIETVRTDRLEAFADALREELLR